MLTAPCPPDAAALPLPPSNEIDLGGLRCRVVPVDDFPPQACVTSAVAAGQGRVRLRWHDRELAHFSCNGRRWVVLPVQATPPAAEPGDAAGPTELVQRLSNRELQIVQLVCAGLLTKQVAGRLHLSEFTVRSYLKTIYHKLGVHSRGAMVFRYAQSFGVAGTAAHPGR